MRDYFFFDAPAALRSLDLWDFHAEIDIAHTPVVAGS